MRGWLAWIGFAALAVGCGGSYDASVSGSVTLDGAPLPRGTIKFNPLAEGPASYGLVGNDGSYAIQTGREPGLPSGDYAVTIVANEPSVEQDPGSGLPPRPGKPITPPWYRSAESSPLKQRVEPGKNRIDLQLTTQPPPGWNPRGGRRSR